MAAPKTDSALNTLPGYFQMRQPRAADMQPSPPQTSGFSAPSATESSFRVLASNPPDVTKSATFSTPPAPRNPAIQGAAQAPVSRGFIPNPAAQNPNIQGRASAPALPAKKPATQPAYTTAGDTLPKGGSGGTGFVGFDQYFGANAPAVQAQARRSVANAKDMEALNQLQKSGGMDSGKQPMSPFDVMLGQDVTAREATKAGQTRFKNLSERLGATKAAQQAQGISKAQKENAYAQWTADLPTQLRYNYTPEELRQMFDEEYANGTWSQNTPAMVSTPGSAL